MTREEVINELEMAVTRLNINGHMDNNRKTAFEMAIESLKEPPRVHAQWFYIESRKQYRFRCKHCRKLNNEATNFCPNCGAVMKIEKYKRRKEEVNNAK